MKTITVTIKRGTQDQPFFSSYSVEADDSMSVMDVLNYIYENLDGTLAFFSHEACHQMACGKCLVRVNGKVCLACGRSIEEDELLLEPWNDRIVRDLLCK